MLLKTIKYKVEVLKGFFLSKLIKNISSSGDLRIAKYVEFDLSKGSKINFEGNVFMDRYCRIRTRNKGVVSVGNMTTLNRFCSINCIDKITIGNSCKFGESIKLYDHDYDSNNNFKSKPIIVGNNVWIGSNVIILKGSVIGDNAVIAAGAVVKNIVKENEVFFGIKK